MFSCVYKASHGENLPRVIEELERGNQGVSLEMKTKKIKPIFDLHEENECDVCHILKKKKTKAMLNISEENEEKADDKRKVVLKVREKKPKEIQIAGNLKMRNETLEMTRR